MDSPTTENNLQDIQCVRIYCRTMLCSTESFGTKFHTELFKNYCLKITSSEPHEETMSTWMPENSVPIIICGGESGGNTIAFPDSKDIYHQSPFIDIPVLKHNLCLFANCTLDDHSGNFKILVHDFADFSTEYSAPSALERYKQLVSYFNSEAQLKDNEQVNLQWCGYYSYAKKSFIEDRLAVGHQVVGLLCLSDEPGKMSVILNKSESS